MVTKSRGGIIRNLGLQTTIYKINNKDLLYSTGDYIQYLVITYNGKDFAKEIYTYICMYMSVCVYIYI